MKVARSLLCLQIRHPGARAASPAPFLVIVEADPERASILIDAVGAAGGEVIAAIGTMESLSRRVRELNPGVLLIDVAPPSRDTIEDLPLATPPMERPVALFVDCTDADLTRAAIEAGISAYVMARLQPDRVGGARDDALARVTVTGTAALALMTLGWAEDPATAQAMTQALWSARPRDAFSRHAA